MKTLYHLVPEKKLTENNKFVVITPCSILLEVDESDVRKSDIEVFTIRCEECSEVHDVSKEYKEYFSRRKNISNVFG